MHADHIRPRVGEGRNILIGVLDHEVAVEGQVGAPTQGRHNSWTDGDVGDEMTVHDIQVDDIRTCLFHRLDLFAEAAEIGG